MKFHGVSMAGPAAQLRSTGASGRHKNNIHRDMLRKVSRVVTCSGWFLKLCSCWCIWKIFVYDNWSFTLGIPRFLLKWWRCLWDLNVDPTLESTRHLNLLKKCCMLSFWKNIGLVETILYVLWPRSFPVVLPHRLVAWMLENELYPVETMQRDEVKKYWDHMRERVQWAKNHIERYGYLHQPLWLWGDDAVYNERLDKLCVFAMGSIFHDGTSAQCCWPLFTFRMETWL